MQWLLLGDLPRLQSYTLRRNEEYIVSSYWSGQMALVEADFRLSSGPMVARRIGNSRGSDLEVTAGTVRAVGPAAEALLRDGLVQATLPLSEIVMTSGLLQQDDLRQLLQTKPDERYRQLLRLLGLEVLERFDRFAAARRSRARESVKDARARVEALRAERQALAERIETARSATSSSSGPTLEAWKASVTNFRAVLNIDADVTNPADAAGVGAVAKNIADSLDSHLSALAAVPPELPAAGEATLQESVNRVAARHADVEAARAQVATAQASVSAVARVQDSISRLAAAALPLLDQHAGDAPCPVCETIVDYTIVAERLRARAEAGSALAAAEEQAAAAMERLLQASAALEATEAERDELAQALRQRADVLGSLTRSIRGIAALRALASNGGIRIGLDNPLLAASDVAFDESRGAEVHREWINARSELLLELRQVADGLRAFADAAAAAVSAQAASRIASERASALPRQQAQLEDVQRKLATQEDAYEAARRAETATTTLAQQATAASTEIFRERFAALEPLMNDIYSRLDPHPAFTHLDFNVETYRSKGTAVAQVVDHEADIRANPMVVFSSAQANSVVLAAFLAIGWAARERGLPFVLLDDPLQALDDVNVLGFADVARRLRRQRQLVVATHEERFALLLERKLTGRSETDDLLVHHFQGWSRGGPTVDTYRVQPRPDLQIAVLAS